MAVVRASKGAFLYEADHPLLPLGPVVAHGPGEDEEVVLRYDAKGKRVRHLMDRVRISLFDAEADREGTLGAWCPKCSRVEMIAVERLREAVREASREGAGEVLI
jgi:hypothetical protein